MTTLYLIRHAEAEGNLYRRIHGWYDALITENGYRQIQALETRFTDIPIDAVYSSDLIRTQTTAQAICRPKNLPLTTHKGLREVHMGLWEDHPWGEIRHLYPAELSLFNHSDPAWRAPNGESLHEVGHRMEKAVHEIVSQHPDQTIAIFSHGTAIRQFLARVQGISPSQWHSLPHSDNTAVSCLAYDEEGFHIVFEGDNSHLDESISTLARQSWWKKDKDGEEDVNLWFRPLDLNTEQDRYLAARRDAWMSVHGPALPFDGPTFLEGARNASSQNPWAVCAAMNGERFAGVLQCNPARHAQEQTGFISFFYVTSAFRLKGLGVQLLGQAISFYRALGRNRLRLRCAVSNAIALHFYQKYGFRAVGQEQIGPLTLDTLELPIQQTLEGRT